MNLRQPHRNFLTRAEVAQLFEVAPNTVNRWVLAGQLPSVVTPGGRRRYPAAAIMQLIDEQMRSSLLPVLAAAGADGGRRRARIEAPRSRRPRRR